jgi:CRP/FNR family transcriptional regulator, polysaccharide utilization system transcription regulator
MNGYGNCQTCKSFLKSAFCSEKASTVSNILAGHLLSISFKKGQEIYKEGTPGKGVFCVQKGKIKIYKICEGRNLVTDLATDGDLIGYANIMNEQVCINSAKCIEDSQVCFIPQKTFKMLLEAEPGLILEILKRSCSENDQLSNFIAALKCKNTEERIACALTTLEKRFGVDEAGCIDVYLTRKDISEISGTTTESAIRILNSFKKDHSIAFQNSRIKIIDKNKLKLYKST